MATQSTLHYSFFAFNTHTHIHEVHLWAAIFLWERHSRQGQFGVQYFSQGHFSMQNGEDWDWTTNIGGFTPWTTAEVISGSTSVAKYKTVNLVKHLKTNCSSTFWKLDSNSAVHLAKAIPQPINRTKKKKRKKKVCSQFNVWIALPWDSDTMSLAAVLTDRGTDLVNYWWGCFTVLLLQTDTLPAGFYSTLSVCEICVFNQGACLWATVCEWPFSLAHPLP